MGKAIPRFYETEKKKILEQNKGNQKNIDYFIKYLDAKNERFIAGLKMNREKYKTRLGEPAMTGSQPTIYDFENGRDAFSNGYLTDTESATGKLPVYKVDPAIAELCKKDKPQWILISWEYSTGNPVDKHQHESILNNFNFEYVYKFFFDPSGVKGQVYRPLRSPAYQEAVVITEASDVSKKNAADKNIHFFEDFSATSIGKKPVGWQAFLSPDGSTSVVTKLEGVAGNWAVMANGNKLSPGKLNNPLPRNFTLSYELVAAQNFTWGAKGLIFQLNKETSPGNPESYLQLKLRPGYGGNDGELTLETKFPSPPGYSNATKWFKAPGFSNDKKINRITVIIKKAGENLQVFIDSTKIAEYEKAIPEALLFNAFSFYTGGGDSENDKYFITNIKITKD